MEIVGRNREAERLGGLEVMTSSNFVGCSTGKSVEVVDRGDFRAQLESGTESGTRNHYARDVTCSQPVWTDCSEAYRRTVVDANGHEAYRRLPRSCCRAAVACCAARCRGAAGREGISDRLRGGARRMDVIIAAGTTAIRACREATTTIPIVSPIMSDPVELGFAASLGRPGSNVTGLAVQFTDLVRKQLQLLKEIAPRTTRIAILFQALGPPTTRKPAAEAARALGLNARVIEVRYLSDLEDAFKAAKSEQADALHVLPSPFFNTHRARLVELAARYRLPAVYEFREYVDAGGLMSYGPSARDMYFQAAGYVDRVLRGAKAGELPIEQPKKFELVINQKIAKALGLTIPQSLLLRADQVIE